jgi:two-component system, LytTR family, response regulator LytT
MKIIIIEDEIPAAKRLKNMLKKINPDLEIAAIIDGIEEAVNWLQNNKEPDLIIADIQLSDGLCFEIFRQVTVKCAVIFTTAYDEYAIEAFKVNSIDYLLKPLDKKALNKAIEKYNNIRKNYAGQDNNLESLLKKITQKGDSGYKTRFLVTKGQIMKTIQTTETAFFVIDNQLVFLVDKNDKYYIIEHSLDELESMLDPEHFFRINRQMIVSFASIKTIHPYFNSRLQLFLQPNIKNEVLVSRMKVNNFKRWLDK